LSNVDASQQYAMMMVMELPYHHIIKDWTAHPPRCSHKVQPQQAVDYLADSFASLPQAMSMLLGDKQ
jgi:hypothetical protein